MKLQDRRLHFSTLSLSLLIGTISFVVGCDSSDGFRCPSVGPEGLKPDIVAHVNQFRAEGRRCGGQDYPPTAPVRWNDLLGQAAIGHSSDMAANQFVGHTGSDGSTVATRLTAAGYGYSTFGENILTGANSSLEAANSWMSSADHCANIMNPGFTEIGVAAVKGDQVDCETLYWTMDLARPSVP